MDGFKVKEIIRKHITALEMAGGEPGASEALL